MSSESLAPTREHPALRPITPKDEGRRRSSERKSRRGKPKRAPKPRGNR